MGERQHDERTKPPGPDARTKRLADALRSNLQRRKAQARGRDEAAADPENPPEKPVDGR